MAALQKSGATKHGDNFEVKAWGAGRWVGRSDRRGIFIHKVPTWQISRRWEVLSEKSSRSAHLISYMLSQSICYQTLLGMLGLSGLTALVSMTPLSNVLQTQRHLSWNTALLQKPPHKLPVPTELLCYMGGVWGKFPDTEAAFGVSEHRGFALH